MVYEAPSGIISLMVESSKAAVVAAGEEIHYGTPYIPLSKRTEIESDYLERSQPVLRSCLVDRKFGAGLLHGLSPKHG
jgi:hypothetical protein